MKKTLLFLLLLLLISGCVTTTTPKKTASSWIGHYVGEIVMGNWGAPHEYYTSGDSMFITYIRMADNSKPIFESTAMGKQLVIKSVEGKIVAHCRITFEIKNTRIVSWKSNGESCK